MLLSSSKRKSRASAKSRRCPHNAGNACLSTSGPSHMVRTHTQARFDLSDVPSGNLSRLTTPTANLLTHVISRYHSAPRHSHNRRQDVTGVLPSLLGQPPIYVLEGRAGAGRITLTNCLPRCVRSMTAPQSFYGFPCSACGDFRPSRRSVDMSRRCETTFGLGSGAGVYWQQWSWKHLY
jgi:hypothetical protein